ncbi:MAG: hypothetical protein JNL28_08805 [Planctomycetes bacterium]|nr:hypothetical protein [Planctomycetota bacterium]
MDLPIRLVEARTAEKLVSVDGAWNQPGLNLSHWPGNTTPPELKRDLSTEVVFAFQKLPQERRAELSRGCVALANNHYDTDGICALFAARHPERALRLERELVDIARAGDFFQLPSERAFQLDVVLNGLVDPDRSPWRDRFAGLDDRARRELVMCAAVDTLDDVVTGDLDRFDVLWRGPLERLRADRAALASCTRDDIAHLDLCVFTARGTRAFDPGRHALFGSTAAGRILAIGERPTGATYRFLIGTSSWFDLVTPRILARPALAELSRRLNALEGSDENSEVAWRHHLDLTPSPELWFGREGQPLFSEHAPCLEPSRLAPAIVRREILEALRANWEFPDDA